MMSEVFRNEWGLYWRQNLISAILLFDLFHSFENQSVELNVLIARLILNKYFIISLDLFSLIIFHPVFYQKIKALLGEIVWVVILL